MVKKQSTKDIPAPKTDEQKRKAIAHLIGSGALANLLEDVVQTASLADEESRTKKPPKK